jgi:hypothetical protein
MEENVAKMVYTLDRRHPLPAGNLPALMGAPPAALLLYGFSQDYLVSDFGTYMGLGATGVAAFTAFRAGAIIGP